MEIGEAINPPDLTDLSVECPFDHELEDPPKVKNNLVGKGGTLATHMNNGASTKLYKTFAPKSDSEKVKWGQLPQKDKNHVFYKKAENKGRCITIHFEDGTSKEYPVSCSAHHLIPSQESLKDHEILQYMCEKDKSQAHNHGYADGVVWSDVGYDTNGSENGVYLPGSYAVGGGKGGIRVWYPAGEEDDDEHDTDYIEVDVLPPEEYEKFLISGTKGEISTKNACWHYVAQAMLMAPGQFHDRHVKYSEQVVRKALDHILTQYQLTDIVLNPKSCKKCEDRRKKIEDQGLPAPYSIVNRLEYLSNQLRKYLTAKPGGWRKNIYTSDWCHQYMQAVLRKGKDKEEAEYFEKK